MLCCFHWRHWMFSLMSLDVFTDIAGCDSYKKYRNTDTLFFNNLNFLKPSIQKVQGRVPPKMETHCDGTFTCILMRF